MKDEKIKDNPITIGTIFNSLYPFVLSISLWFFLVKIVGFNQSTEGYSDVLESIINFSSIIIGFYTAMYGVMIGLADSDIFKIIRKNDVEGYLKFQLYDSLIVSFLILSLSIVMQVLAKQTANNILTIFFNAWVLVLGYFAGTSFRSISLLLRLMFKNTSKDDTNEEDSKRKEQQIEDMRR